ncbi:MAG TPA: alpha-amylase family glycosyl hydrolase [Lachnospiraceae bacterium]|nr:alpha-amylase family glycosyl hydrolase [Lachnospiraceae bacterium]
MQDWLKNTVFYEIYPQSFLDTNGDGIGDFKGIIEKLDYIKDLGCNAIWMNPCYDSPFMDAGYDVRDYNKCAQRYGTNEDLRALFEEAHKKEMYIILDLVPGHTSDQHAWFQMSCEPEHNEYTNRYIWTENLWDAPNDYRFVCGTTDHDGNYMVNFFSSQPALNYGFHEITHKWQLPVDHPDCMATREALKSIMKFWLDLGCDGFRVDMADSLVKNDDDKIATMALWKNITEEIHKEYPKAVLVSEWSCPRRALGCGFDVDFYLDHNGHGYHSLFRNIDENGQNKSFFSKEGKGDATSFIGEYMEDLKATADHGYISFITCNHDTPRMSKWLDERELKIAYATILTLPGVPFLYYGDEIGMPFREGLTSKEGGFSRTGTRTPMQWNTDKNCGFSSSETPYLPTGKPGETVCVQQEEKRQDSLYQMVKEIIACRHEYADLQADGSFSVLYVEKDKYPFIYQRGNLIVMVNPSSDCVEVEVCVKQVSRESIFKIGEVTLHDQKAKMGSQSFAIYKMN